MVAAALDGCTETKRPAGVYIRQAIRRMPSVDNIYVSIASA